MIIIKKVLAPWSCDLRCAALKEAAVGVVVMVTVVAEVVAVRVMVMVVIGSSDNLFTIMYI